MTMNRHEEWGELVSASLTGDLTTEERARLDAHLAGCADCRATLSAFSDQRQIVAGLRHLPVPADLGARVRTGIEGGSRVFAGVGGGLAVVAGALLAIVLLNGSPQPQIGDTSPTPSGSFAATSATPMPSAPAPSASPAESAPAPSAEPTPAPTPLAASPEPEPDVYLALTGPFDNQMLTLRHGPTGETIMELGTSAVPIAAELSPDGQWLAYITQLGESGLNEVRATRIAEGTPSDDAEELPPVDSPIGVSETIILGESVAGSPFLEHLAWSSNSQYLSYTLADPNTNGTDVWVFQPSLGEAQQLTDVGTAYTGSWVPGSAGTSQVWISTAGDEPVSYLRAFHDSAGTDIVAGDPAEGPMSVAEGIFQPLLSPNGSLAIYWKGRMVQSGAEWLFAEGGAPYLAEHRAADEGFEFANEREMFSDLTIGRSAFASAAITWGGDGDAYAVWGVQWTGTSQGPEGTLYPNEEDVYFSHATDARGVTRAHAIDAADMPEGSRAVDVKVSPTGEHLVIAAARPRGGVLDAPAADLLLVKRNTGVVADEVFKFNTTDGWFGPAAFEP
jgi:hypothetical protein